MFWLNTCFWGILFLFSPCAISHASAQTFEQRYEQRNQEQKAEYEKSINDEMALMPTWFRKRYKPWSENMFTGPNEMLDIFGACYFRMNPLLRTILVLGIVFYPIWFILIVCLLPGAPEKGGEFFAAVIGSFIIGIPICYIFNVVLSWVLYGLIYLVVSLFSHQDVYVHWSFISYCLHAVVHLTGMALIVSLGLRVLRRVANAPSSINSQQGVVSQEPGKNRLRFAIRSMAKAFFVAIATGVGSQLGGWLGGAIVFIVASGVAAFLGAGSSTAEQP